MTRSVYDGRQIVFDIYIIPLLVHVARPWHSVFYTWRGQSRLVLVTTGMGDNMQTLLDGVILWRGGRCCMREHDPSSPSQASPS